MNLELLFLLVFCLGLSRLFLGRALSFRQIFIFALVFLDCWNHCGHLLSCREQRRVRGYHRSLLLHLVALLTMRSWSMHLFHELVHRLGWSTCVGYQVRDFGAWHSNLACSSSNDITYLLRFFLFHFAFNDWLRCFGISMFRMCCRARGFWWLSLLCCSSSNFFCRRLWWLDDLDLLGLDSFWMVSIFCLPFSLSLRLALLRWLVVCSGLAVELPRHRDINASQRRVGSELCPSVYYRLALKYKLNLFLLLFYFLMPSSWIEVDRGLLIHDNLSLFLVDRLNNFGICTLYRFFGWVGWSKFRFWIMPPVSGLLNLRWWMIELWILILWECNWTIVIDAFIFTLSCFHAIIRAVIVLRSNVCVDIWQQILVWITIAARAAVRCLRKLTRDDLSVLRFGQFDDSVVVFDRAVARVLWWWDLKATWVALAAGWVVQFGMKMVLFH